MNGFLLDRDVLGAIESPSGNKQVRMWADGVPDNCLFVSAITVMEARKGFAKLRLKAEGPSQRAEIQVFEDGFDALLAAFDDRLLPIDRRVADQWAELLARRDTNVMDAAVAATAAIHELVVATRNLRHFRGRSVRVIDPFKKMPTIESS